MKEWQTHLIGAFVIAIIGLGFLLGALIIQIPSAYKTFLGIPYSVNPEFVFWFNWMIVGLMLGFLYIGMGLGLMANTYSIYRLEKKIPQTPPPPFSNTPSFCRYCGTQNIPDAVFCSKCGKKLT
jgi:hypothetical protein